MAVLGLFWLFYVGLNYDEAARHYERHYGEAMPLTKALRYWDVFHRNMQE